MALDKITYPAKNIGDLWRHNEANEIKQVVNDIVDAVNGIRSAVNHSQTTVSIRPNVLNVWGSVGSLNITFLAGDTDCENEYKLQFYVNSSSFTLNLPSGVQWVEQPEWEVGYTYQVSILNNLALYAGWGVNTNVPSTPSTPEPSDLSDSSDYDSSDSSDSTSSE